MFGENFPLAWILRGPKSARIASRQRSLTASRERGPSGGIGLGRRTVVALSDQAASMSSGNRAGARGGARAGSPGCERILTIKRFGDMVILVPMRYSYRGLMAQLREMGPIGLRRRAQSRRRDKRDF